MKTLEMAAKAATFLADVAKKVITLVGIVAKKELFSLRGVATNGVSTGAGIGAGFGAAAICPPCQTVIVGTTAGIMTNLCVRGSIVCLTQDVDHENTCYTDEEEGSFLSLCIRQPEAVTQQTQPLIAGEGEVELQEMTSEEKQENKSEEVKDADSKNDVETPDVKATAEEQNTENKDDPDIQIVVTTEEERDQSTNTEEKSTRRCVIS